MFKLILVCAVLAVASAGSRRSWNSIPPLDGRIVGGSDANIEDFPYQLSLQSRNSHICGASIISEKYVVTAAHCTDGSSASSFSVRAGSSKRGSGGQVVNVAKIHQHPKFSMWNIDYDISVLELASNLEFGAGVQPVALPNSEIADGAEVVCTGWGTVREGSGSLPTNLQKVSVNIVGRGPCRDAYGDEDITNRMICAGVNGGGKDACQGDSGGPLVGGGQLVGVVSWGYGCARPTHPGVYSNVAELRSYITEVSGI